MESIVQSTQDPIHHRIDQPAKVLAKNIRHRSETAVSAFSCISDALPVISVSQPHRLRFTVPII